MGTLGRNFSPDPVVLYNVLCGISFLYGKPLLYRILPTNSAVASMAANVFHAWVVCELIFFVHYSLAKRRLEKYNQEIPDMSLEDRWNLINQCLETIDDPVQWCTGWFREKGTMRQPRLDEIRQGNVREWLAWAFWGKSMPRVSANPLHAEQLDQLLHLAFEKLGSKLSGGYNDKLQCIRLNLDPIRSTYRPLVLYGVVYILTYLFDYHLMQLGFNRYEDGSREQSWGRILLDDAEAIKEAMSGGMPSPGGKIVHWHRPATGETKGPPIVFVHGIAAGLMSYHWFIKKLLKYCGEHRGLIFIEMPYVSMHINQAIPTPYELVNEISKMLDVHGYDKATFMGHSLGTCVVNWVVKDIPERVAGVTLLDPVVFLLHYSDLAYNFVHRAPTTPNERLISFFAAQELYTAFYIARRFDWNDNMMFIGNQDGKAYIKRYGGDNIPLGELKVFLSENDNLINSQRVLHYLKSRNVDCQLMPTLDHAAFLFRTDWGDTISRVHAL
ncbi:unnamed protein product [Umbelopsis ramanniana]